MNINNLTLGELKQIQALLGGPSSITFSPSATTASVDPSVDPLVGKYVIVRTFSAGVHAGTLVSQEKDVVLLADSRRLWDWKAKQGVALSGVAQFGLAPDCKIDSINPLIRLTNAIETILASDSARVSINEYQ